MMAGVLLRCQIQLTWAFQLIQVSCRITLISSVLRRRTCIAHLLVVKEARQVVVLHPVERTTVIQQSRKKQVAGGVGSFSRPSPLFYSLVVPISRILPTGLNREKSIEDSKKPPFGLLVLL